MLSTHISFSWEHNSSLHKKEYKLYKKTRGEKRTSKSPKI